MRVEGENPRDPEQPITSRGQIFSLNEVDAGKIEGLKRASYDGQSIEITLDDVIESEVTTRDIDRGEYQHYLWKEINEAPRSFSTTLQGKFNISDDSLEVDIPEEIFSKSLQHKLAEGHIKEVLVIGQGTAANCLASLRTFF